MTKIRFRFWVQFLQKKKLSELKFNIWYNKIVFYFFLNLSTEKYYERQLSINPPSTADAAINGALTATTTGGDEDLSGGLGDAEEMLMNKSEFLLNELTVGDRSHSPLTSADIMAIMMMTMSNAATADQISLNGVSSSLATTALPTVLTPLYTDNDQYMVHQRRRRRHRSSSSANNNNTTTTTTTNTNNKKYLRRRRKTNNGGGQQPKANRKSKLVVKTDGLEGEDQQQKQQDQSGEKVDGGGGGEVEGEAENGVAGSVVVTNTEAVRKPRHRKRKRILNMIAANLTPSAIVTADGNEEATGEFSLWKTSEYSDPIKT